MNAMDRIATLLAEMPADRKAELIKTVEAELSRPWLPTPGPQLEAFASKADLLLYGGAAGGGKTDLICGLALTEHKRTVVFRRQASDVQGFWDRLVELCPNPTEQNGQIKRMVTSDGRLIETGHLEKPGSELSWQGRPHDFIGFDEGAQLSAYKVNFVLGWLRSADASVRCRAIIATNPPMNGDDGDGAWLVEWFAPWLDPLFPNPAAQGELRWAITLGSAAEIRTVWVDGPDPVDIEGETYYPLSRTYIKSLLDDNPYLATTGYRARINAMPEPLRSQLLYGDFMAGKQDNAHQVIPTAAVKAAQDRWTEAGRRQPMLSIAADIAQGGADKTTLAPLHVGSWFDHVTSFEGRETPDGPSAAAKILMLRRDGAAVGIDTTGGWGGSARDHLRTHNGLEAIGVIASAGSSMRDKESGLEYGNLRAEMWWEFRKDLCDPSSDMALPPSQRLLAELTAPRFVVKGTKLFVESKDEIRKRLGSSTDEADAVLMAWLIRRRAGKPLRASAGGNRPQVNLGHAAVKKRRRA